MELILDQSSSNKLWPFLGQPLKSHSIIIECVMSLVVFLSSLGRLANIESQTLNHYLTYRMAGTEKTKRGIQMKRIGGRKRMKF